MNSRRDVVLAGDFNVVPTNQDIYNSWAFQLDAVMQPETRAAYSRLLSQGWVDATRKLHPEKGVYTFWVNAEAFSRNAGFRTDFLSLSPSASTRLLRAEIDMEYRGREKPSDHAPVCIELTG